MSQPAAKGAPNPEPVAQVLDPALAADEAKSLLKSMRSFLADSELQSARIRVAVTIPVGLLCIAGWLVLRLFGTVFQGQATHPETMLLAGIALLLIGMHGWVYRGPSVVATTVLAAVIASIYGFAVAMNGLLPTIFLSAVVITSHSVAPPAGGSGAVFDDPRIDAAHGVVGVGGTDELPAVVQGHVGRDDGRHLFAAFVPRQRQIQE